MPDYEKLYEERKTRVETAVANKTPDRVPNVMRVGTYPLAKAGITNGRAMVDFEAACQATYDFYARYSYTDVGSASGFTQAAKVLEALDTKTARWPGDPKGLPEDNTYQFVEFPTLLEDEYDELLDTPAQFWLTKHLPRTLGLFEEMGEMDYMDYISLIQGGAPNFFTSPGRIPMYKKLLEACEENQRKNEINARYDAKIRALGYYNMSGGGSATAFDMLGDTLRGTMGMMPDMILQRENVKRALDVFVKLHIKSSLDFCRATGCKYAWVMLHKGFDNFISDEDYAELYWPYLRQWIMALIENDIVPVVYTEGSYTTRLKYLKDVPAGKVVYHFEEVDLKLAKKELGDIACLQGGYPAYTLTYGTPQEVEDKAKEVLDIMAPGGGYLFTTGYSIDDCPQENLERLFEVVQDYGKY